MHEDAGICSIPAAISLCSPNSSFFLFFVVVTILRNFELLLATIGIAFDAGGSH